jgi:hypothetical protein
MGAPGRKRSIHRKSHTQAPFPPFRSQLAVSFRKYASSLARNSSLSNSRARKARVVGMDSAPVAVELLRAPL